MTETRRLTAILAADAHGYTRLMGEDEVGTMRTLTAHRATMREVITRYRGRVVDAPGDNLLAEFASVVDAVDAAASIQRELTTRNRALPEGRRLQFRIGVNLGDVISDGDRIYGDSVNVAARLQALAAPGGIAISGTAYEHVESKLPYHYQPLGEQVVKNITRPVRVYRVVDETQTSHPQHDAPRPDTPMAGPRHAVPFHQPSIAVLPFREYDARPEDSYFAEAIVDDIVGALASLPDLFVISRSSTLTFRGPAADVRTVGQQLGVQYVLSGSVRRAAEKIRTLTELCDTETGGIVWTDSVEGSVNDVFALQDRLSERIVTTIAPQVRQAELRRALRKRPESLDAYDFVLRGLHLLYRLRRDEFERAHEMFERAIELDPAYATPYALSALWYSIRVGQGWSDDLRADFETVNRLASAALERDPFDARALALCGHVKAFLFRDYDTALALFARGVAASPNSSTVWMWSSPTYSYIGDGSEAARRAEQALRLSPLDPHVFLNHTALALANYTRSDFEEAVAWGRKAIAGNPRYTAALRIFAASLTASGRLEEAQRVARMLLDSEPSFRVGAFCDAYPYKERSRREMLARHLQGAGLPA
jgi:adenylate cyclase